MIYFTSDQHFHLRKPMPKVGERIFSSNLEKNEFQIERWNQVVTDSDEVYILGDFSDGDGKQTTEIARRLKGRKYLITGNNDHYLEDPEFDLSVFAWNENYRELIHENQKYVLFHFPIEVWTGYRKDRIHLHGHLHRREAIVEPIRRYDVGVDAHNGYPVSIDVITQSLEKYHNQDRAIER